MMALWRLLYSICEFSSSFFHFNFLRIEIPCGISLYFFFLKNIMKNYLGSYTYLISSAGWQLGKHGFHRSLCNDNTHVQLCKTMQHNYREGIRSPQHSPP
ncbi:hypothetical protein ACN42_g1562 [Penicillium freii]|uniref:Uncharacterized protein n=1 Tax=Penicillium freii TaxID=48697 RepID=A0A101MRS2_PENFR|nr:hypothetical protein ACN42_g1562 [Penicillium freii]